MSISVANPKLSTRKRVIASPAPGPVRLAPISIRAIVTPRRFSSAHLMNPSELRAIRHGGKRGLECPSRSRACRAEESWRAERSSSCFAEFSQNPTLQLKQHTSGHHLHHDNYIHASRPSQNNTIYSMRCSPIETEHQRDLYTPWRPPQGRDNTIKRK